MQTVSIQGMLHWTGDSDFFRGFHRGKYPAMKMRDIIDGTSITLFVGEYHAETYTPPSNFLGSLNNKLFPIRSGSIGEEPDPRF